MEMYQRVLDDMTRLTEQAIEIAKEGTEILKEIINELEEMGVLKLVIKMACGEVVVLRKDEAVCPICGYEF